ncbi:MAG: prepilin-type N-terminal cleavage/methylation domain-containing protein [Planctomycetes bacterium]|nr:prepilin-type N-terminal cleavage/methylation domain-containing protein [Planctomycetota bacterium]
MKYITRKSEKAFSLVEVIVASIILSTAVVALCAVGNKSMTGVKRNREYEHAWELMDKQLTMISSIGIDQFLEADQFEGQIGEEDNSQARSGEEVTQTNTHYWTAEIQEGEADYIYELKLTISWGPQNRPRNISVTTRFNGQGTFEETEEENQDGQEEPR